MLQTRLTDGTSTLATLSCRMLLRGYEVIKTSYCLFVGSTWAAVLWIEDDLCTGMALK